MTDNKDFGVRTAPDTLEFQRLLPGPVERVWAYLTDPGKRARWFAGGPMELSSGGRIVFEHDHDLITDNPEPYPEKYKAMEGGVTTNARVVRTEAPRLMVFDWFDEDGRSNRVSISLEPADDKVRLTLIHSGLTTSDALNVGPGWHMHLDILSDELAGVPRRAVWSPLLALEEDYERRLAR